MTINHFQLLSLRGRQKLRVQHAASNFPPWLQFLYNDLWVDRQAHVSPLSGHATGRYPAGYGFPVPFGMPAFAS